MSRALVLVPTAVAGLTAGGAARLLNGAPEAGARHNGPVTSAEAGNGADAAAAETKPKERPSLEDVMSARGSHRMRVAAEYLLSADAEALVDMAARFTEGHLGASDPLWTFLMTRWAGVDAAGMIAWARSAGRDSQLLKTAFRAWLAENPAAACAAARSEGGEICSAVLGDLTRADPNAALVFARSLPKGEAALNDQDLENLAAHWPDLEQRLANPALHYRVQAAKVMALARTDPLRALAEAGKLPRTTIWDRSVVDVMEKAAAEDPVKAAAIWSSLPRTQAGAMAALSLVKAWALKDTGAALEWAQQNLTPELQQMTMLEAVAIQSSTDPAGALRLLTKGKGGLGGNSDYSPFELHISEPGHGHGYGMGTQIRPESLLGDVARRLRLEELAEALSPSNAMDKGRRSSLLVPVLEQRATTNTPEEMASFLSKVTTPEERAPMTSTVINAIAKGDPVAAAAALPTLEATANDYGNLATSWMKKDEAAASAWVRDLPPGEPRDLAANSIVNALIKVADVDYDAALQWASDIQSAEVRRRSEISVWKRWMEKDPSAARAALEGFGYTPEEMEKIEAKIK